MNDNNSISKDKTGILVFWLLSILVGIWVIYRAVILSITNDEAFTFYNIATRNIKMMCGTANTHWLNSIFIFFETLLIGNKEWMIRIHSFVAYFAFVWAIYKISKQYIVSSWQLLIPVSLIILNTYLLDFFSLARGYGISLTFEILAFYFIAINNESPSKRFLIYLFLALATFSCYTCIFVLFSYFLYDTVSNFNKGKFQKVFSKKILTSQIPFFGICLFAIPNILFIRKEGDLEEGQNNGFIADPLGVFFGRSYNIFSNTTMLYILCIVLFTGICIFYLIFRNAIDKKIKILFEIFFINILLIEFLHFVFAIPYVFGRTALYIDILFLLLIVYVIIFISNKLPKTMTLFAAACLLLLSTYYFIFCKNHRTTVEWWKSQGIENITGDLEKMEGVKMYKKRIGMHLSQLGAYTNYYQFLYKPLLSDTVYSFCENRSGIYDSITLKRILEQDYVLMLKPYDNFLDKKNFSVLKYYKDMNSDLLRINK